jgi:general L-amino acid transport system permease protein
MDRKAAARWCSRNLFASRLDTAVTVCLVPLVIWAAWVLLSWAIGKAQWHVVADNFRVLMVGAFPSSMMERAWISFALFSLLTGATLSALTLPSRQVAFAGVSIATLCAVAMALASNSSIRWTLAGLSSAAAGYAAAGLVSRLSRLLGWLWGAGLLAIGAVLVPAGVDKWGGLLLSLVVTLLASVLSVPIGVALAFGRRSRYSSLRILCTGYIEVMRSLPLILVVYWVWLITPLFLSEATVSDLWRGLLGFSIFFAA